ncbi:alpha/beta hydrolase fold domain-containing protein [Haloferula rosea]|uniref:Alpha/beta hydrolase fold domain-containing protein n=1 Tax=Haloferula rosea TaxID=490093 RepID=A0A934R9G8_9BACT|nr:alpha/beta hydrolase fold domain-containing protein [Haloferula rosea]MBK1826375.1 alpha/beta hydrolase fold domain-containing protein [Haloferula rosea]
MTVLLAAISVAWSASELPPFEALDKDRDGRLSKLELPVELQGFFDKVDRDGDGFVSRLEDRGVRAFLRKQADAPPLAGVEVVKNVDYVGDGNTRQMLDIYRPKVRGDAPLPVVCWIHGGGWRQGSKDRARRLEELVATGNYAGVSIGYRLTQEATWPAQIHDCKAAIRWLKANAEEYGLDASRVAVWGASAGGHLVAMLGVSQEDPKLEGKLGEHLDESSSVRCVVNFFGPSELLVMDEQGSVMNHSGPNSPESLLVGGPIAQFPEVAKEASPIHHVDGKAAPMLLVHGTSDKLVPYGQSLKLSKALQSADVEAPLITIKGGGHGNGFGRSVDRVVAQYLGQQLLGEAGRVGSQEFRTGE